MLKLEVVVELVSKKIINFFKNRHESTCYMSKCVFFFTSLIFVNIMLLVSNNQTKCRNCYYFMIKT